MKSFDEAWGELQAEIKIKGREEDILTQGKEIIENSAWRDFATKLVSRAIVRSIDMGVEKSLLCCISEAFHQGLMTGVRMEREEINGTKNPNS